MRRVFIFLVFMLVTTISVHAGPKIAGTIQVVDPMNKRVVIKHADGSLSNVKFTPNAEFYCQSMLTDMSQFTPGMQVVVHIVGALNDNPLKSDQMMDMATMVSSLQSISMSNPPLAPVSPGSSSSMNASFPNFPVSPLAQGGAMTAQASPMGSPVIGEVLSQAYKSSPGGGLPSTSPFIPPAAQMPLMTGQMPQGGAMPSLQDLSMQAPPMGDLTQLMGAGSQPTGDMSKLIAPEDEEKENEEANEQEKSSGDFQGKVSRVDSRSGIIYMIQMYPPDLLMVKVTAATRIMSRKTGQPMRINDIKIYDLILVSGEKNNKKHQIDAKIISVNQ